MVALVVELTAVVLAANWASSDPSLTVTLAGTVTALEDEANLTDNAPLAVPGSAFRVTTPLALEPPVNVEGVMLTPMTSNGVSVNVAVCVVPPEVAVIVTVVALVTGLCVTANMAVVAPAASFTDAGTVTSFVFELLRERSRPAQSVGP